MRRTWICLLLVGSLPGWSAWAAEPEADPVPAAALELDDTAEPLVPLKKRGGREDDRIRALALFAAARVAEQKQDYPLALRNYQRRFDSIPTRCRPCERLWRWRLILTARQKPCVMP